ncbi:SDR family oxidoreductase [Dongshaea marina]|uniref:SDR family oxidoreductase n=1 Tax=Dongshaea marina TaxID=2047966 RepID=UPI001902A1E5|nr:SDR family oxidoreductase [Dongshaea marina]
MSKTLDKLADLSSRVALVTGGAGHLGRLCCNLLVEQGAKVIAIDRQEALQNVVFHDGITPIALELASIEAEGELLLQKIERDFGRLDILVNNAAFVGTSELQGWSTSFAEQSIESWRACLEVNLTATFALSQLFYPLLSVREKGVIVNIGSIYGEVGPDWSLYEGTQMANPAAYAASKGGLHQLTRWLATTLAPKVRANTLVPGGIFRYQPKSFVDAYCQRTPLRRMAKEEDLAGPLLFLCSDMSCYMTGARLDVDGGWQAW